MTAPIFSRKRLAVNDFRNALLALPFVKAKPDGTLDMWAVKPSGLPYYDVPTGRGFCAWFLHFVRDHDAAHIFTHVAHSFYNSEPAPHILSGWGREFAEALVAADETCSPLLLASGKTYHGGDLHAARLALPFVKEREDGTVDHFAVDHDAPEGSARGRYYAALCAKYMRDTGDLALYPLICADFDRTDCDTVLSIGFLTALCEIATASSLTATTHQKAAKVHFNAATPA
ncbi:hypothetical protein ACM25O_13190 [Sulfitobacter pontiacus]